MAIVELKIAEAYGSAVVYSVLVCVHAGYTAVPPCYTCTSLVL